MGSTKECPNCGSTARTRSRQRAVEHLMLGLRPFRCLTCQRRFYGPKDSPATPAVRYIEPTGVVVAPPLQPVTVPARPATANKWFLIQDVPPGPATPKRG